MCLLCLTKKRRKHFTFRQERKSERERRKNWELFFPCESFFFLCQKIINTNTTSRPPPKLITFGPNFIYQPIPKTSINLALEPTQPVDFFHFSNTLTQPSFLFSHFPTSSCVLLQQFFFSVLDCVGGGADMFFSMSKSRHKKKRPQCFLHASHCCDLSHQQSVTCRYTSALGEILFPGSFSWSFYSFLMDSDTFHQHTKKTIQQFGSEINDFSHELYYKKEKKLRGNQKGFPINIKHSAETLARSA